MDSARASLAPEERIDEDDDDEKRVAWPAARAEANPLQVSRDANLNDTYVVRTYASAAFESDTRYLQYLLLQRVPVEVGRWVAGGGGGGGVVAARCQGGRSTANPADQVPRSGHR